MTISATSIGTAQSATGGNLSITVGVGGVPAGATIILVIVDRGAGSVINGVTDSKSNSYATVIGAQLNAVGTPNGPSGVVRAQNITALVSGDTITYAGSAGTDIAVSALYVIGAAATPIDSAVTASATGHGTTPSVTSGTPSVTGEMFIAAFAAQGIASFTQDTGHGWATPPNQVQTGTAGSNRGVGGGSQVNAGTGTKIFAPTLGTAVDWAAFIIGLQPTSSALSAAGSAAVSFAGMAIIAATLSAAGSASVSDVGAATAVGTMSVAGSSSASFTGAGVKTGSIASSGAATTSIFGSGVIGGTLSVSGVGTATFIADNRHVVSTNSMQRPVDYSLAGDQREYKKGRAHLGALKGIFRE